MNFRCSAGKRLLACAPGRCLVEEHYREVACKLAGIDRKVLLNWLKRGEREQSGVYRDLYLAVEQAEAKAEVFHLK